MSRRWGRRSKDKAMDKDMNKDKAMDKAEFMGKANNNTRVGLTGTGKK